jgi:hypothetical protein
MQLVKKDQQAPAAVIAPKGEAVPVAAPAVAPEVTPNANA